MYKSGFTIGTVLIFLLSSAAVSWAQYSGGSGTEAEPFEIDTVIDWQHLMDTPTDWDKHFILTADLDVNGVALSPVGNYSNKFTGVFDGNDHIIYNADVNMPGSDYVGLFGYISPTGQISNLGVEDIIITGWDYVGGLVGYNNRGSISNCYSTGPVSGDSYVGGLVGYNYHGSISNCYSTGSVTGDDYVGGLVGYNYRGSISNCYSTGSVSGGEDYVGGLVGYNAEGTVTACYATGDVLGDNDVGGLVGKNAEGTVTDCYATGIVSGYHYVGGLVGYNVGTVTDCSATGDVSGNSAVGGFVGKNGFSECVWFCDEWDCWEECWAVYGWIYKCYSTGSVSGVSDVGGLVGFNDAGEVGDSFWDEETGGPDNGIGTPKLTEEMQTESTFTDAGWDFVGEIINGPNDIWDICEGTNYPRLTWQIPAADWLCPDGVGLEDFSYLGGEWQIPDNSGSPANLDGDEDVGFGDVKIFCELWLAGR